ncbi:MAG: hypothetical protein DSY80_07000 [Desulfocapsa sp.]|nr:MAG: hypothetical protein DSY80_07000 [Desulfocapsa sp.]
MSNESEYQEADKFMLALYDECVKENGGYSVGNKDYILSALAQYLDTFIVPECGTCITSSARIRFNGVPQRVVKSLVHDNVLTRYRIEVNDSPHLPFKVIVTEYSTRVVRKDSKPVYEQISEVVLIDDTGSPFYCMLGDIRWS